MCKSKVIVRRPNFSLSMMGKPMLKERWKGLARFISSEWNRKEIVLLGWRTNFSSKAIADFSKIIRSTSTVGFSTVMTEESLKKTFKALLVTSFRLNKKKQLKSKIKPKDSFSTLSLISKRSSTKEPSQMVNLTAKEYFILNKYTEVNSVRGKKKAKAISLAINCTIFSEFLRTMSLRKEFMFLWKKTHQFSSI